MPDRPRQRLQRVPTPRPQDDSAPGSPSFTLQHYSKLCIKSSNVQLRAIRRPSTIAPPFPLSAIPASIFCLLSQPTRLVDVYRVLVMSKAGTAVTISASPSLENAPASRLGARRKPKSDLSLNLPLPAPFGRHSRPAQINGRPENPPRNRPIIPLSPLHARTRRPHLPTHNPLTVLAFQQTHRLVLNCIGPTAVHRKKLRPQSRPPCPRPTHEPTQQPPARNCLSFIYPSRYQH